MPELPFAISRDDVLNLAAQKIADEFTDTSELRSRADKLIEARVSAAMASNVNETIGRFLDEQMTKIIGTEFTPVDIFGDPTGKPTSLKNALVERARTYWSAKVNSEGKESDGYSTVPRHQWLFSKIVKEQFVEAIKQNVVNVIGALKDAIRKDAQEQIDKALNELLRVKSLGQK